MHRLGASAGFFVALLTATFFRLDTASALQSRCRPAYRNLPGGVIHTACKGPNPKCKLDKRLTGLNEQLKDRALQIQNNYRAEVAGGARYNYKQAKDMSELEWDDELAEVAQAFAEQCVYSKHDKPEARITTKFKSVGQCIGWSVDTTKQTITEVDPWIEEWYREHYNYNPDFVSSYSTRRATGRVDRFAQIRCLPEYKNLPGGIIHTACEPPNPLCIIDYSLTGLSD
ncbi:scoloptoxin SSD43 [Rhipicephalus sanguineus]|uniref:SCP domain-containing protein n=1 Tax=Rhipicephalus sanguineus TaxID=34632 RepID=A0A9D4Q6D5_RHISA|nr:scoloptoxin SSD43 [Rhipicephalus sanguineus]KAH7968486.1 hypothetical protein HPB52_008978 [Rhipicephalus sanguineus]